VSAMMDDDSNRMKEMTAMLEDRVNCELSNCGVAMHRLLVDNWKLEINFIPTSVSAINLPLKR